MEETYRSVATSGDKCIHCPSGSLTWRKGETNKSACRCRPGYFTQLALNTFLEFESKGCYNKTPPTYAGNSKKMTLGECNWMCLSMYKSDVSHNGQILDDGASNALFAVMHGSTCYCGKTRSEIEVATGKPRHGVYDVGLLKPRDPKECTDACKGDKDQVCGAEKLVSVYTVKDVSTTETPCEECPVTKTATGPAQGARCSGGFFPPFASKNFWAQPAKPFLFFKCFTGKCDGGSSYGDREGHHITLQKCGKGAKGVMCAGCKTNHFKRGKDCIECFPISYGWIVYILMPIIMLLGWNPFFYWFIGGGIGPSLFVSYAFLQITAAIGGFACAWPESTKSLLGILPVVNFDFNLLFFDCSLNQPSFLSKWVMYQSLPVFYTCYYFGQANY